MSHVLEHFTAPLSEINIAYENLKQGGLLYIEIPNNLIFIEPHIAFWSELSFLRMYGDYLADKFMIEEFGTWGPIYRLDEGINGDFQRAVIQILKDKKINRIQAARLKTPNGTLLKVLLRKRR